MADDIRFSIRAQDQTKPAFTSATENTQNFDRSFTQMTGKILSAGPAFAVATAAITGVYAAISAVTSQFTDGLKAIETYRMATIQMASVMTNFSKKAEEGDVAGAWIEASEYSAKMVKDLEIIDARSAASGRNIVDMTRTMITYGVQIDTNSEKQRDSLVALSNAIQTLTAGQQNQDMQFIQEIRAVMEGVKKPGSVLLGLLERAGLNAKEFTRQLQTGEKTIADMLPYLEGFSAASGDLDNTWTTIGSTLDTTRKRVLRAGLEPAFEDLLQLAKNINDTFVDMDGNLTQAGHTLKDFISNSWNLASNTAKTVDQVFGGPGTRWVMGNFAEAYNYILSIGNAPLAEGGALDSMTKFELFGKGDSLDQQLNVAEEQIRHWRQNNASPGGWIASLLLGEDPLTYYERKAKEIRETIQNSLWLRPATPPGPPELKVPTISPVSGKFGKDSVGLKRGVELNPSQMERRWEEEQAAVERYEESLISLMEAEAERDQVLWEKVQEERERKEELKAEEEEYRQDKLISIEEFLMTEKEMIWENYFRKSEFIQEQRNSDYISEVEFAQMSVNLEKWKQEAFLNTMTTAEKKKQKFTNASNMEKAQIIANDAAWMVNQFEATNETLFNIQKVFRLRQAGMNLIAGVQDTFNSYIYPYNLIMAGLHAATGAVYLSQLASSSFNDGASSSVPYVGSASQPDLPTPVTDTNNIEDYGEQQPSVSYHITIVNAYGDKDVIARDLLSAIDKAREDGY